MCFWSQKKFFYKIQSSSFSDISVPDISNCLVCIFSATKKTSQNSSGVDSETSTNLSLQGIFPCTINCSRLCLLTIPHNMTKVLNFILFQQWKFLYLFSSSEGFLYLWHGLSMVHLVSFNRTMSQRLPNLLWLFSIHIWYRTDKI